MKQLQFYCKCLPASVLIDMRKILFWTKIFYHVILHSLAVECRQSVGVIADSYNVKICVRNYVLAEVWMFVMPMLKLNELLYFHFIDAYMISFSHMYDESVCFIM